MNKRNQMNNTPNAPMPEPLSPAAQAVLDATSRAKCIREWRNVNDPPCHPSDLDWQGCATCRGTTIPVAALRAASNRMMDLVGDICHPKYIEGVEASSNFLDQIATELENQ
jgi:hypothetical protein